MAIRSPDGTARSVRAITVLSRAPQAAQLLRMQKV
jgi:hypothetical protein